jgi:hypothetical protein
MGIHYGPDPRRDDPFHLTPHAPNSTPGDIPTAPYAVSPGTAPYRGIAFDNSWEAATGVPGAAKALPVSGRGFARLCLGSAVVTAGVVGIAGYLALDSVDFVSADPFGVALGWLELAVMAGVAAVVVVLASLVAVVRCRPRTTAVMALISSLGLPVLAVVLAVLFGVQGLASNAGQLGGAATRVVDLLDSWHVPVGPLRDIVHSAQGTGPGNDR